MAVRCVDAPLNPSLPLCRRQMQLSVWPSPSLLRLSQEDTIRWRSGIYSTEGTMWSGSWDGATSPQYGYAGTYSESHHTQTPSLQHDLPFQSFVGFFGFFSVCTSSTNTDVTQKRHSLIALKSTLTGAGFEAHVTRTGSAHHTCTCWQNLTRLLTDNCNQHRPALETESVSLNYNSARRGNQGRWLTGSATRSNFSPN